ncbi:MAG: EamA family transporter [Candidatus Sungbacteria bacterium]|nr:EamA family transporter [bacterium]MDZ4260373.1 EamA family transporter [Candidatus Sungbacteria bacterium]
MFYLLCAIVLWGVGNFLLKVARFDINTSSAQLGQIAGVIFGVILFYSMQNTALSPPRVYYLQYVCTFLAGAAGFLGTYLFLDVLGVQKLGFASQFSSLSVLVATALGIIFLKESITLVEIIGGVLMVSGAILLGMSK